MSLDAACAAGASLVVQAGELDDLSGVELLREADRTLLQASSLGPSSPTPWVWLLHSGRALRISTHELRLRYDHAVRDQPVSFDAASALLLGVSPRASGSRDEMFEFARSAAGGAPGGSVLHVLPVVAHIEQAIRDHPAGGASFAAALASQRADITDAAAESVDHASFVDDNPDCARARNIICFALAFAGDEAAAVRQRDAIGTRLHTSPWQLLGDPATVYATAAGH